MSRRVEASSLLAQHTPVNIVGKLFLHSFMMVHALIPPVYAQVFLRNLDKFYLVSSYMSILIASRDSDYLTRLCLEDRLN